ncbi:Crp/Fnr family transcriptional regulator [Ramlibacter sp.]|uniref:Crp/Fnr family transcriptional regulator n=1 Tax=Ramlibacter sp. TaxID=1917967 RepID=UPI0035AF6B3F
MTSPAPSGALLAAYPWLAEVQPGVDSLPPACGPLTVPAGTPLFAEHAPCQGFPLVIEGEVQVARSSDDGRSLELYRVQPGELCLVSSACLFSAQPLTAHGVATRPTTLLLVPPEVFTAWLAQAGFRAWVLGLFAERMADLTSLVDAVAFHRLDQRLAAALLGHGPELAVTHQQLADTLGTVREIVTRLLRRFEREGWVALGRERVRILDSAALRRHAGPV